jgi:hypothetical protein
MKVVINRCVGRFSLSWAAFHYLTRMGSPFVLNVQPPPNGQSDRGNLLQEIPRNDPLLIQAIEALGEESSSGESAVLKVVEVPDDVKWEIIEDEEWYGYEYVVPLAEEKI